MVDKFIEEIKETARKIIRNLSTIRIDDDRSKGRRSKERVKELLQESKARGEIVDFLPTFSPTDGDRNGKKQRQIGFNWHNPDFWITLVKKDKHVSRGLKVKSSQAGADKYQKRQRKLKKISGREFMRTLVLVAGPQRPCKQLEKDWQEILIRFKKS